MSPLNWNQLWKKDMSLLIILMVVVPIAGELN
ncbi:histidine kinase, partial [Bacillus sp. HC-Mk]